MRHVEFRWAMSAQTEAAFRWRKLNHYHTQYMWVHFLTLIHTQHNAKNKYTCMQRKHIAFTNRGHISTSCLIWFYDHIYKSLLSQR